MAAEKNYWPFVWRAAASTVNMAGAGYQLIADKGRTPVSALAGGAFTASLIYFSTNAYEAAKEYRKPSFSERELQRRASRENQEIAARNSADEIV